MSDSPESPIEDRLRSHYRHLRTQPPPNRARRGEPRLLVGVACLILVLSAGGAYIAMRDSRPGQPVQADTGTVVDGSVGDSTGLPVASTTETRAELTIEPEPTITIAPDTATTASGLSGTTPNPDPKPRTANVDGSPVAPNPGTVLPPTGATLSMAYGIWAPTGQDSCSKEIHDSFWVYGPDGKVYPTYHPPVDPTTGCTFGHEHGRDPAGSDLADIPFPFGYVSEQELVAGVTSGGADHVGHKIEWYNDGGYYEDASPNTNHDQICDVAYKLHLSTHSDDAFERNTHEVFHYARCENGSELIYRALHRFGNAGEFNMHCNQGAGPAVIVGQGSDGGNGSGSGSGRNDARAGSREIPAAECFEDQVLVAEGQQSNWFAFDERWTLYQSVDSEDFGRFFIQLQFFVDAPARYWDGEKLAHTVDLCYLSGARQVRDDEFCEPIREASPGRRVQWDDVASPFDGTTRQLFMGDLRLDNNGQQAEWYTDIYGGVWSAEPFAGSIRQHVGTTPFNAAASYRPDPIRSITFDDDVGIHAPN